MKYETKDCTLVQIRYRAELPGLMRRLGLPMIAAEIGVAEGLHSAQLLQNGIENLYMVDLWEHVDQKGDASQPNSWHDRNYINAVNLCMDCCPVGSKFKPLKGYSVEQSALVPDESLGLVYIDGDHSFAGVWKDLHAWFSKLVPGGIMAGHDFLAPEYGVRQAVEEFVKVNDSLVSKVYLILEDKSEDAGFYFFKK